MKALLWILGATAAVLAVIGALNRDTEVSFDYAAGTSGGVSVLWLALAVAAALVVACVAGWVLGRGGEAGARSRLERELELTYRRLRECEARLPKEPTVSEPGAATAVAPAAAEATREMPVPAAEDATVTMPAPAAPETTVKLPAADEDVTVAVQMPYEGATVEAPTPAEAAAGEGPSPAEAEDAGGAARGGGTGPA